MGAERKSYPRFRREGEAPRIELTDDDIAILRHVYRHRFIRADDLYRLFGDRSPDKLSRRLTRLFRNEFLDRPIAQVDRFHEGGSRAMVYGLDNAGARYLKEVMNVSVSSADWKARNRSYRRESLDHTLSISRFMVDLEIGARAREGVSVIHFDEILAGAPERTRRLPQPGRWPVELQWFGSRAEVQIIPDAIFGLRAEGADGRASRTFVFLEIDRGTMTIAPARPVRESEGFPYRATILRKLLTYAESYRQELHKKHLDIPAARVLTLTTSPARAEAMREAAEHLVVGPQKLPPGLFLFGVQPAVGDPLGTDFVNSAGVATPLVRAKG
jgi:hypothetical protein